MKRNNKPSYLLFMFFFPASDNSINESANINKTALESRALIFIPRSLACWKIFLFFTLILRAKFFKMET